jgi:hypothetical protein
MFKTQEELEEYLRGDPSSIQCLICKKQYRHLTNHISSKHGISVIDYRQLYGIPRMEALFCSNTKKLISQKHLELCKDPVHLEGLIVRAKAMKCPKGSRTFKDVLVTKNKLIARNVAKTIYTEDKATELFNDIKKSGLSISRYCIINKTGHRNISSVLRKYNLIP